MSQDWSVLVEFWYICLEMSFNISVSVIIPLYLLHTVARTHDRSTHNVHLDQNKRQNKDR